jgi:hypothetical protein
MTPVQALGGAMTLLALILAIDAILHGYLVKRFGVKENEPFLIFAFIDAALAVAVFFLVPYALWAAFLLTAFGIVGLTVTFGKPQREKTLDKIIWGVDALALVWAAYLLFLA